MDSGLVTDHGGGLYDLREMACEYARARVSEKEHEAALRRPVEWCLRVEVVVDYSILPPRWRLGSLHKQYLGVRRRWTRARRGRDWRMRGVQEKECYG